MGIDSSAPEETEIYKIAYARTTVNDVGFCSLLPEKYHS